MFAYQKKLVEWKNGMKAVFNSYNGNFHCRIEVSCVEWKFGIV